MDTTIICEQLKRLVDESIINSMERDGLYTPYGVRSGKLRTAPFNSGVIDLVKQLGDYSKFTFELEAPIVDCYGKTFDVDIAIYNQQELCAVILTKVVNGDYNRNRNNYQNTYIGETVRVIVPPPFSTLDTRKNVNVLFMNLLPTIQADYDRDKNLLRYATLKTDNVDRVVNQLSGGRARVFDIMYENKVYNEDALRTKSSRGKYSQQGTDAINTTFEKYYNAYKGTNFDSRIQINTQECNNLFDHIKKTLI